VSVVGAGPCEAADVRPCPCCHGERGPGAGRTTEPGVLSSACCGRRRSARSGVRGGDGVPHVAGSPGALVREAGESRAGCAARHVVLLAMWYDVFSVENTADFKRFAKKR